MQIIIVVQIDQDIHIKKIDKWADVRLSGRDGCDIYPQGIEVFNSVTDNESECALCGNEQCVECSGTEAYEKDFKLVSCDVCNEWVCHSCKVGTHLCPKTHESE